MIRHRPRDSRRRRAFQNRIAGDREGIGIIHPVILVARVTVRSGIFHHDRHRARGLRWVRNVHVQLRVRIRPTVNRGIVQVIRHVAHQPVAFAKDVTLVLRRIQPRRPRKHSRPNVGANLQDIHIQERRRRIGVIGIIQNHRAKPISRKGREDRCVRLLPDALAAQVLQIDDQRRRRDHGIRLGYGGGNKPANRRAGPRRGLRSFS